MKRSSLLALSLSLAACDGTAPATPTACEQIGDVCHSATGAAGDACHDVGHDEDEAVCEAMLESCLAICTGDAGPTADAGTDAPIAADAGSDAGPVAVALRFAGRAGAAPFACGDTASIGTPATSVTLTDLRFYVHDVRLITAAGGEVAVTLDEEATYQHDGVALVDLEDHTGGCAPGDTGMHEAVTGTVPPGSYTGVAFTLGVPFDQNHTDVSSAHAPLNVPGLYWSWAFGRIFFAAETTTMGADPVTHTTHVGSTMCTGDPALGDPVTGCARENRIEIRLEGFDAATDTIAVDVAALKASVDVGNGEASCHSVQPTCDGPFDALGIDFSTGAAGTTAQTVFSVE